MSTVGRSLARLVWERAGGACEYCHLPHQYTKTRFEIDHIIANKHEGRATSSNLALSCFYCNSCKGSNIAGLDPRTKRLTPLFHPRRHVWGRHFRWDGARLVGRTPIGRTTVAVLNVNERDVVALRAALIGEGVFPG
jgi:hypothetical protein